MTEEDRTFDCEGCGTILDVGVPHDCPVLGTWVLIVPDPDGTPMHDAG